jgi:hypothetical protein
LKRGNVRAAAVMNPLAFMWLVKSENKTGNGKRMPVSGLKIKLQKC